MRVGVDATAIWGLETGSPSGIVTYTVRIVDSLLAVDSTNSYVLYCFQEIPSQLASPTPRVEFRVFRPWNRKIWQQFMLPVQASRDRLDLLFFPSNSASVYVPCKSVATIHDLHAFVVPKAFAEVHSARAHRNYIRSHLNKLYWRQMLRLASRKDRVIAPSEATKRDLVEIFGTPSDKIDVVYEGVDTERFNSAASAPSGGWLEKLPARYLLCVGTHGYKNLEGAITAFATVRSRYSDSLKLVIAGSKRNIAGHIHDLIRVLGLEADVVLTGYVPDEVLAGLYRRAELLLFPSFYEGFGLPVVEAFACGTPVVTSNKGSLPEVAGDAALLVDPYSSEDIAAAVLRLLTHEQLREEKRRQGFLRVGNFSWEESGRRTLEVFERTVGRL